MDIDVSELNRLAVDLGRAPAMVITKGAALIAKTAYDIEREAKIFAPVDTGNLRNSISTLAIGLYAEIGPTASYGKWVEEGTSVMAPHAYLGPAVDRNLHYMVDGFGQLMAGVL